jgi:hypothetical protein
MPSGTRMLHRNARKRPRSARGQRWADVAFVQRRCEDLLDIGKERRPVHRTVDGIGCCHPIDTQGRDQR